jgi:hypothetical protein
MRKLLMLLLVAFVVFVTIYHQRLFLRDPLATLYIDGAKVPGVQVYINYSNDVLVLRPDAQPLIVQNWDHTPGNTKVLPCLRSMACLSEADQAPKFPLAIAPAQVTMTNREIAYPDEQNKPTRIVLR